MGEVGASTESAEIENAFVFDMNSEDLLGGILAERENKQAAERGETQTPAEKRAEALLVLEAHFGDTILHYHTYSGTVLQIIDQCPYAELYVKKGPEAFIAWIEDNQTDQQIEAVKDEADALKNEEANEEPNSEVAKAEDATVGGSDLENGARVSELSGEKAAQEAGDIMGKSTANNDNVSDKTADTALDLSGEITDASRHSLQEKKGQKKQLAAAAAPQVKEADVKKAKPAVQVAESTRLDVDAALVVEPVEVKGIEAARQEAEEVNEIAVENAKPALPFEQNLPASSNEGAQLNEIVEIIEPVELEAPVLVVDKIEPIIEEQPHLADEPLAVEARNSALIESQFDTADAIDDFEQVDAMEPIVDALEADDIEDIEGTETAVSLQELAQDNSILVFEQFESWHEIAKEAPELDTFFITVAEQLDSLHHSAVEVQDGVNSFEGKVIDIEEAFMRFQIADLSGDTHEMELFDVQLEKEATSELVALFAAVKTARKSVEKLYTAKTKEECARYLDEITAELTQLLLALGYENPEKTVRDFLSGHSPEALRKLISELEKSLRSALYREVYQKQTHQANHRQTRLGKFVSYIMRAVASKHLAPQI